MNNTFEVTNNIVPESNSNEWLEIYNGNWWKTAYNGMLVVNVFYIFFMRNYIFAVDCS